MSQSVSRMCNANYIRYSASWLRFRFLYFKCVYQRTGKIIVKSHSQCLSDIVCGTSKEFRMAFRWEGEPFQGFSMKRISILLLNLFLGSQKVFFRRYYSNRRSIEITNFEIIFHHLWSTLNHHIGSFAKTMFEITSNITYNLFDFNFWLSKSVWVVALISVDCTTHSVEDKGMRSKNKIVGNFCSFGNSFSLNTNFTL